MKPIPNQSHSWHNQVVMILATMPLQLDKDAIELCATELTLKYFFKGLSPLDAVKRDYQISG